MIVVATMDGHMLPVWRKMFLSGCHRVLGRHRLCISGWLAAFRWGRRWSSFFALRSSLTVQNSTNVVFWMWKVDDGHGMLWFFSIALKRLVEHLDDPARSLHIFDFCRPLISSVMVWFLSWKGPDKWCSKFLGAKRGQEMPKVWLVGKVSNLHSDRQWTTEILFVILCSWNLINLDISRSIWVLSLGVPKRFSWASGCSIALWCSENISTGSHCFGGILKVKLIRSGMMTWGKNQHVLKLEVHF